MKKIVRLTESDLHRIINESVKKILKESGWNSNLSPDALDDKAYMDDRFAEREKMMQDDWEDKNRRIRQEYPGKSEEWYDAMIDVFENKKRIAENNGEPESYNGLIGSSIIEDYKVQEIAEEYGISEEEAAAKWFKNTMSPYDFEEGNIPKWREFVIEIPELDCKMYHDYGAGYYFLVKDSKPSALTMTIENKIAHAVRESITRLIETDCAGVMQTGCGNAPKGTNPEAGQYTVPLGADKETADRTPGFSVKDKAKWNKNSGNVQRRPIYNPKSGK